jgi:amino acid transporter
VKESVLVLTPIFIGFVLSHVSLILYGIFTHGGAMGHILVDTVADTQSAVSELGWVGVLLVFLRAFSLGGGTYTGIEAVSNSTEILREPRAETGRRTMFLMAVSLAFTAGGVLFCYLLNDVQHQPGKTLNASLWETLTHSWTIANTPIGGFLVVFTLLTEGALLFVAAQTGFVAGPRTLGAMAVDSWVPKRFAHLSERLVTQNGVVGMGVAAVLVLLYSRGLVSVLVVMYSINVFLTFTLSQLGMTRFWRQHPKAPGRRRHLGLHGVALVLCAGILVVTVLERFTHGGWVTVLLTSTFVLFCFAIHRHYQVTKQGLRQLDEILLALPKGEPTATPLDPKAPTAVLLVGSYSGLGVHTILSILRFFPGLYKQFIFVSVAVVDSGTFKGKEEIDDLQKSTDEALAQYVALVRRMGFPADSVSSLGVEVVSEATAICEQIAKIYPRATIFTGKLVFRREGFFQRLLHNETPMIIQRRLQWVGVPMVVLPVRARV